MDSNERFGSGTVPVRQKLIAERSVDLPIPLAPTRQRTPSPAANSASGFAAKRENRRRRTKASFGSLSFGGAGELTVVIYLSGVRTKVSPWRSRVLAEALLVVKPVRELAVSGEVRPGRRRLCKQVAGGFMGLVGGTWGANAEEGGSGVPWSCGNVEDRRGRSCGGAARCGSTP